MPTIAAFAYKKSIGQPLIYPDNTLDYESNFLRMMFAVPAEDYVVDEDAARALRLLLILHADHEQNCSTSTVRMAGSSQANMYASISAGISALWGPLHGGANQEVLEMLQAIDRAGGDVGPVRRACQGQERSVPADGLRPPGLQELRPAGADHQAGGRHDPGQVGRDDRLLEIAKELEQVALTDAYFIDHKLYPNVDFYSGLIYRALGFPTEMFTVLFAIGRLPGWIAQWREMNADPENRIGRPRQLYVGHGERPYVPIRER